VWLELLLLLTLRPLLAVLVCTGACGGELACSTCHLIFPPDVYATLPPMEDDEVDMLDLAFEVTATSRLGCQIKVRKDMAGMKVRAQSASQPVERAGLAGSQRARPCPALIFYRVALRCALFSCAQVRIPDDGF
jgi:ferredoxin